MQSTYKCPNQVRKKHLAFLMCSELMKDNENYFEPKDAARAYCIHQHHCSCSNQAENTDGARECYKQHQTRKGI